MIDISLGKMLLLAVIALIVLGPEKLPGAARTAGALLRRVRNGWDSVRAEVERELQLEEIKRTAREAAARADAAQARLDETLRQAKAPFAEAGEAFRPPGAVGAGPAAPAAVEAAAVMTAAPAPAPPATDVSPAGAAAMPASGDAKEPPHDHA